MRILLLVLTCCLGFLAGCGKQPPEKSLGPDEVFLNGILALTTSTSSEEVTAILGQPSKIIGPTSGRGEVFAYGFPSDKTGKEILRISFDQRGQVRMILTVLNNLPAKVPVYYSTPAQ